MGPYIIYSPSAESAQRARTEHVQNPRRIRTEEIRNEYRIAPHSINQHLVLRLSIYAKPGGSYVYRQGLDLSRSPPGLKASTFFGSCLGKLLRL